MTKDDLEMAIDTNGLGKVLFWIAEICHEKADHVQTNWQDKVLAKIWTDNATRVEKTAAKVEDL